MIIDGSQYEHDVIVHRHAVSTWRRAESHMFDLDEFKAIVDKNKPKSVVIGNGHDGVMRVDPEIKKWCQEKNIKLTIKKTGQAKDVYNEQLIDKKDVLGMFHLTC